MNSLIEKKSKNVLGWMLLASIVLHSLVLTLRRLQHIPRPELLSHPIEISTIPQQPRITRQTPSQIREKQIAESEDAKNREIDPKAQFLGEHNQKALQEQKAKNVDAFQKKMGSGTAESASTEVGMDGIAANPNIKKDWKSLSLMDLSVGNDNGMAAATDDHLNTVSEGERTILSTREFKFFSYYHRIKELLRQYWRPNVEYQLTKMWKKGRNISADEMTTKVLVLLNEKGEINKISRLASCGMNELDDAAVRAFERAAPFPNPPKGMVDSDGFVRIRWDFILTTDSGPRIQWTTAH